LHPGVTGNDAAPEQRLRERLCSEGLKEAIALEVTPEMGRSKGWTQRQGGDLRLQEKGMSGDDTEHGLPAGAVRIRRGFVHKRVKLSL